MHTTKIGLFGIGLDAYWPQFAGLKERFESYLGIVEGKLRRDGIEIVNLGLIDTSEKAFDAGHAFRAADVDLIFLHVTKTSFGNTESMWTTWPIMPSNAVPFCLLHDPLPPPVVLRQSPPCRETAQIS